MPRIEAAFLADGAKEYNGLVSVLGAFVSRLSAPELPIRASIFLVGRVAWEPDDEGVAHTVRVSVEHADGEQIARLDGAMPPLPTSDPSGPSPGSNVVLPLNLDFRRVGVYSVILATDGEELARLPLHVQTLLPPV
ncbi:MAG: hypothetical protein JF603_00605 [Acidobacteria bacterium]|nr:hypothetical protein [Acidobacteriota bacterium]